MTYVCIFKLNVFNIIIFGSNPFHQYVPATESPVVTNDV